MFRLRQNKLSLDSKHNRSREILTHYEQLQINNLLIESFNFQYFMRVKYKAFI